MTQSVNFEFFPVCDVVSSSVLWVDVLPVGKSDQGGESKQIALKQAFANARGWLDYIKPCEALAVGLDSSLLTQPGLPDQLKELAIACQLETRNIQLELPVLPAQGDASGEIVSRLHESGFKVSVGPFISDDKCFSVLAHPHIHAIRCDWSSLHGVDTCKIKQRFVKALVKLCHALNKHLVVRGVECEKAVDLLVGFGVRCFQGRIFGGPYHEPRLAINFAAPWIHRKGAP